MTEAQEKKTRKKAEPVEETVSAIDRFVKAASELDDDEVEALMRQGYSIPSARPEDSAIVYSYRCKSCNQPALDFVGHSFRVRGEVLTMPPTTVPAFAVPWIQPEVPINKQDRMRPKCQHCGVPIHLKMGRFDSRYVIEREAWLKARDNAAERIRAARRRMSPDQLRRGDVRETMTNPDGSVIPLHDSPGGEGRLPEGAEAKPEPQDFPQGKTLSDLKEFSDRHDLGNVAFPRGR